ncbi:Oidioi.mRNA.OKI2018_I69.XSR.g14978.t1.cds [Oikopleura dioica]|uniref:Oidioi.mRNA.OKI2018_I69.XSR.g14978.t1.cds n=1 Tax=Oikopleura dioica TaxID=34765 RepID=A0ABN7SGK0_OIKDI|nr:Oidioi.mRNA.OKI2018_I69.XSR.g14978.t1.cds [Oikopleura dioica]
MLIGLKCELFWKNGFDMKIPQKEWFLFSGETFKALRREIEMHFQVKSFRLYYYNDEAQLIFCRNDDDLEEMMKLVEQRRTRRNAIRKRAQKPAWFHDLHLIVKDAYDMFDAFDSLDQRDAKMRV